VTAPSPASPSAQRALEAVRPAVERLSSGRSAQDNASDLAAVCVGVESALGALLGRADLSGQALVREARQRESISLEQAHAALELFAVRDRVAASGQVDVSDLDVAREAYGVLARGAAGGAPATHPPDAVAPAPGAAPPDAVPSGVPLGNVPPGPPEPAPSAPADAARDAGPRRGPVIAALVLVALVLAGLYYVFGHPAPSALDTGIAAYGAGHRDSARAAFARAAQADPHSPLPHLYLARLAREDGDFTSAGKELRTAIQLDPAGAAGQRELGAFFLARGASFAAQHRPDLATQDDDAARRAYVRAIQADPSDSASAGYLACALARLGRASDAATWLARAGPGPWSACAASPAQPAARATP